MLDFLWQIVIFPWEQRGIFGVIAIAIGFVVFLRRFMDAKPKAFWAGVFIGGGFFLVAIGWSVVLGLLVWELIWFYREGQNVERMMSTDRQMEVVKFPTTADNWPTDCVPEDCTSCSHRRECYRSHLKPSEA